ncbi:type VII secretion protein EccE [Mycobacterium hubeiense]|uniref:type VII secretion protein EccE n=1 Tax=Mycobacterium hubeiense TaxID=1867256 RepID=UPI001E614A81|nr:type VII secretion protein EccE [Mycobacterium sp. QGD 101]
MTARITLALLFIVPAAMAYPWSSTVDWWLLGTAVTAVIVLFAWWRGAFVTDLVGRRIALWRRNRRKDSGHGAQQGPTRTTALLQTDAGEPTELPLPLIVSYLDRYGISAASVRITSGGGATWIGLTLDAAENLAALQARSPQIPLRETAEITARRLADHLRETGVAVTMVDGVDGPAPRSGKETWRGMRDESGYVAAYRVDATDRLAETLAEIRGYPSNDTWTAIEFSGSPKDPKIAVGCSFRTNDKPTAGAPLPGLTPHSGRHRPALQALSPRSVYPLEGGAVPVPDGLVEQPQLSRT